MHGQSLPGWGTGGQGVLRQSQHQGLVRHPGLFGYREEGMMLQESGFLEGVCAQKRHSAPLHPPHICRLGKEGGLRLKAAHTGPLGIPCLCHGASHQGSIGCEMEKYCSLHSGGGRGERGMCNEHAWGFSCTLYYLDWCWVQVLHCRGVVTLC